ncbi:MAG: VTT domain-containing protein [Aeromicrobium erythreum]
MGGDLAIVGAAFLFGVASAILPVLNAEAYVVGLGALVRGDKLVVAILALTLGTSVGKAIVFELVRKGSDRFRSKDKETGERKPPRNRFVVWWRRFSDLLLGWLERPYLGAATVFVSSLLSVPPLAVVTVLAALSKQPHWLFQLMVFLGRSIQFLVIAFLIHHLV